MCRLGPTRPKSVGFPAWTCLLGQPGWTFNIFLTFINVNCINTKMVIFCCGCHLDEPQEETLLL